MLQYAMLLLGIPDLTIQEKSRQKANQTVLNQTIPVPDTQSVGACHHG